jgi:2'-5' RNA ligase
MRRRIFIAINLPEDIKKKLQECQQEWSDLPVRFTKKNSLHLTLYFIGYVSDEEMLRVCQVTREVAQKYDSFAISFNRICLGPPGRPPRLIWLEGEKNDALFNLKIDLENSLMGGEKDLRFFAEAEKQTSKFIPHITLARIRQMAWKQLQKKPVVEKEILISVPVNSIEVMESDLKRDGVEYIILETAVLGKN